MNQPLNISRDKVSSLSYVEGDVMNTVKDIQRRSEAIHKATYLGNLKHQKVYIQFNTGSFFYQVHTTIWLHYNNNIYLKGNIKVPVERILGIHF
ncbi:MAG TPA: hypothetical protein DIT65_06170 [Cryomorphaceae bacterium]|nr:hypothetical protein [Cryomorphaceae bacterium]